MALFAAGDPALGNLLLAAAGLVVMLAVLAIRKGMDVRLALMTAALTLGGLAGDLRPVVRKFLATFSDESFVIPICSAMGFAYVLKLTQCDRHLVHLLTKPLRKARLFLIPGVVAVGFLVNIPVVSQTSTAVCLGAVVVPLMRAANISAPTIGASILLGASIGGELLNPGAPEFRTISEYQDGPPQVIVAAVGKLVFYHLAIAAAIFWALSVRYERQLGQQTEPEALPDDTFRVNLFQAVVPLVPLAVLFMTGPPLNWFKVPLDWVADNKASYNTRLIGLAMLFGVVVAAIAAPRSAPQVPRSFFEGAGYAYAAVVSLIITASCFAESVKQIGLNRFMDGMVKSAPDLLIPLAAAIPLAFAALSGSGIAATQGLYGAFVPSADDVGVNRVDLGAVVSIGAAAGRTMSPVAAVCLMSSSLTGVSPFALAKRVAPPLLISWAIVVALRVAGVI